MLWYRFVAGVSTGQKVVRAHHIIRTDSTVGAVLRGKHQRLSARTRKIAEVNNGPSHQQFHSKQHRKVRSTI